MEENTTATTVITQAADQLLAQLTHHENEAKRLRVMIKELRSRLALRARARSGKRRRGAPQGVAGNGAEATPS